MTTTMAVSSRSLQRLMRQPELAAHRMRARLRAPAACCRMGTIALVWVAGCTVGPDYHSPRARVPEHWSQENQGATTQPAEVAPWCTLFDDPTLTGLIDRAVRSNLDLRIARGRLCEARALRAAAAADFWPQGGLSSSYQYEGRSLNRKPEQSQDSRGRQMRDRIVGETTQELLNGSFDPENVAAGVLADTLSDGLKRGNSTNTDWHTRNFFEFGFDASWEIDVFGGLRRGAEAAAADADAAREDLHDVLLTLVFEVARDYVEALGYQQRIAIAQKNIAAQTATVRLADSRYKGGLSSELDVVQAQAQLASTRAQLAALETDFQQAAHRLSLLLGEPPDATLPDLTRETPCPVVAPEIPLGLPSDLLRRRPDIRRSERQLAAATARIGVATADLFPRFSLTGTFGSASTDVRHILDSKSLFWTVGPAVSWPILDGGRILANVHVREAIQEQALASYELAILRAVSEVEDARVAFQNEHARRTHLADAVGANDRAVRLATAQYNEGVSDFLDVIDSERSLRLAEDQRVQSETALALHAIGLFKALGGGWQ